MLCWHSSAAAAGKAAAEGSTERLATGLQSSICHRKSARALAHVCGSNSKAKEQVVKRDGADLD